MPRLCRTEKQTLTGLFFYAINAILVPTFQMFVAVKNRLLNKRHVLLFVRSRSALDSDFRVSPRPLRIDKEIFLIISEIGKLGTICLEIL